MEREDDLDPEAPPPRGLARRVLPWALLAAAAAFGFVAYRATREEPYAALRAAGTPSADAHRRGGVPLAVPALRDALADDLPRFGAIALHGGTTGADVTRDLAEVRERLLRDELARVLPPHVHDALRRLAAAYPEYVAGHGDATGILRMARRLDETLVQSGLAYRVEPRELTGLVNLFTYEVHRVERRGVDRISYVYRLDPLNVAEPRLANVLGDHDAVVPLRAIERELVSRFFPLVEPEPIPTLVDRRTSVSRLPFLAPTHAAVTSALRRDLEAACPGRLAPLVDAFVRRRRHFELWAASISGHGIRLVPPLEYRIDLESLSRYEALHPRYRDLVRLDAEFARAELAGGFACIRDAVAADFSVAAEERLLARHEREPPLVPSVVVGLVDPLGVRARERWRDEPTVLAVRAELAALSRARVPSVLLAEALVCWTDGGRCTRLDEGVVRIVFVELARELGKAPEGSIRDVGAAGVAAAAVELVALEPARLREVAAATYRRLFGRASSVRGAATTTR